MLRYLYIICALISPLALKAQPADPCSIEIPADITAPPWLDRFDKCNRDIHRFIERRLPGLEFYAPALEQLSQLDHTDQLAIVEKFFRTYDGFHDTLRRDLSLPISLIDAILLEAEAEGADTIWDIPAFEEVLFELREDAKTESGDTFAELRESYAPISAGQIFFVVAKESAEERLADAQGRLVDAQGQLRLAEELEERANTVAVSAQELSGAVE